MPWFFVGRGRKLMVFDHNLPAYTAYWLRTLDKTRRLSTQPPPSFAPTDAEQRELGGFPNFDLFTQLVVDSPPPTAMVFVFVFAAPFASVAIDDELLNNASSALGVGEIRRAAWSMTGHWTSKCYRALVLRLTYLAYLIEILRVRAATLDKAHDATANECRALERSAIMWRDAHVMLTLALEELGYVPTDGSPEWQLLLARYSPDVNMVFHTGEMPDVHDELLSTPIVKRPPPAQSAQNKVRAANPVSLAFTKVCPRRCGMRDLVEILLEYALRNVASLHFVMLIMAASYLGIYEHCRRRPDLPMTRDIYRLFFFELAAELKPHRRGGASRPSEADTLSDRFQVVPRDIHIYVTRGQPRVKLCNYTDALRAQYRSAGLKAEKAVPEGSKVPANKSKKSRPTVGEGGSRTTSRQRSEAIVATVATTTEAGSASSTAIVIDDDESELRDAVALSNATSRLEFDRQCGYDYYELRRAAGMLPLVNNKQQEFVSSDINVTDVFAYRRIAECDRQMPTAVEMTRRNIVYSMLGTLIEYDSPRPTNDSSKTPPPSKEYVFTNMLTQQIREFMFALLDRNRPMYNELCARVQWRTWQHSVIAISDLLRGRLSDAYSASSVPFLRRHHIHYRVGNETNAPTNNLYTTENQSFVTALHKVMAGVLQTPKFLGLRVDYVAPREYGIMMAELLRFYNYPRSYSESSVIADSDELASTTTATGDEESRSNVGVTATPYIETITPALPPFSITLDNIVPPDDANEEWIQQNLVKQLLFPGRTFHMTTATIDEFNRVLMQYCNNDDDNDKLLATFAKSLAQTSVFQYMLVYYFVRAVDTYISIFTVPLPKHITDQQMRVMCLRYGCTDPAFVPRHAHYSYVCLSCRRFAGFLATAKRPNMKFADGTGDVRTLDASEDQEVFRRVKERGRLLAPDELTGAQSMFEVFDYRAMQATTAYDRFTRDKIDNAIDERRQEIGFYDAVVPFDPWGEDTLPVETRIADELFASADEREAELAAAPLPDWRLTDPIFAIDASGHVALGVDLRHVPLPPIHAVAVDGTVESELYFHRRVRNIYDRLMGGRFLIMGQRIPTHDNRPYSAQTDSKRQVRQELKKRKTQAATRDKNSTIMSDDERKHEADKLWRKCCRDVITLSQHIHCSNELMFSFRRIGEALVIAPRGRTQKTADIYVDCCGCGTSVQMSLVQTRGAWWFCPTCINDGTCMMWLNGGPEMGTLTGVVYMGENSENAPRDVQLSLASQLMSPNRSWLPDICVRQGDKCVHPRCRRFKMPGVSMVSREVVFDTHGKERVGYISICAVHQKMFPWIFTLPFMLTRSMLGVLLHDNKTTVSLDELRSTDYLATYMTRLADISSSSTRGRAGSTPTGGGKQRKNRSLFDAFDGAGGDEIKED